MGPRWFQVALWRVFQNSAFKRKPTEKSTGGKTTFYRRPTGGGRE